MLFLLLIVVLLLCCGGGGYWGYRRYYGPGEIEPVYDDFVPAPYPGTPNNPDPMVAPSTTTSHMEGRTIVSTTTFGEPGMPVPPPTTQVVDDPVAPAAPFPVAVVFVGLAVLVLLVLGGGFWGFENGWGF